MPERISKRARFFEEKPGPNGGFRIYLLGGDFVQLPSKSAAKLLADALNREIRAALFKPKSSGKRARTKGHSFEREVAIAFRKVFPEARRHLEYQDSQANGVDLAETGPFRVQCKKLKKYAPLSMIKEVQCEEWLGEIPVLVTAGDKETPLVALPLENFINLIGEIYGRSERTDEEDSE